MKTNIDGQEYRIVFQYVVIQHELYMNRKIAKELPDGGCTAYLARQLYGWRARTVALPRRATRCIIERVLPEEYQTVCYGQTVCNPVDNFTKETGRRLSLERAIKAMPDDLGKFAQQFIDAYEHRGDMPAMPVTV